MIQILVIIKNYARTLSLLTGLQINLSREFRFTQDYIKVGQSVNEK